MSGPTALLYPNGIIKCPWQYRKINGTWCRRPVNTNGKWQKLRVERIGWPPDRQRSKGDGETNTAQSPSIYKWHWDQQR